MPVVPRRTFLFLSALGAPMARLTPGALAGLGEITPMIAVPADAGATCSFCARARNNARFMVAVPGVQICGECLALCAELVAEGDRREESAPVAASPEPEKSPPHPAWMDEKRAPTRAETIAFLREGGGTIIEGDEKSELLIKKVMDIFDPTKPPPRHYELPTPHDYIPARKRRDPTQLACSFCGRSREEVAKLIAGPACYVCDLCVSAAKSVIATDSDVS